MVVVIASANVALRICKTIAFIQFSVMKTNNLSMTGGLTITRLFLAQGVIKLREKTDAGQIIQCSSLCIAVIS